MSIRLEQLPDYLEKVVTAQYDVTDEGTDEDFREVTGKVLAVSTEGLVLQTRSAVMIIEMKTLLDLEVVVQTAKLIRRWISLVDPLRVQRNVMEHLIDQHAMPRMLVLDMSIELAVQVHDGMPCTDGLVSRDFISNTPVRLTRRWIQGTSAMNVRQHLLDRHGMPFSFIKAMDDTQAFEAHDKINHSDLGHAHGEKPQRRPGRPRKEDGLVSVPAGASDIVDQEAND